MFKKTEINIFITNIIIFILEFLLWLYLKIIDFKQYLNIKVYMTTFLVTMETGGQYTILNRFNSLLKEGAILNQLSFDSD